MFQTALDAFYSDEPNYILSKPRMKVRIDCYLAVLKKFQKTFPTSHFEVITRTAGSPLSPSWQLLHYAKAHELSFPQYALLLLKELKNNPAARKRIFELRQILKERVVFLVCYEKNPAKCHRTIIKHILEELWPLLDLEALTELFPGE